MKIRATTPIQTNDTPMLCRIRRMSRAPQNWLMKIAPPDVTPKQNRMNKNE